MSIEIEILRDVTDADVIAINRLISQLSRSAPPLGADAIRRIARTQLSVVPVAEPGADPGEVIALPAPAVLAAAASTLQVEAARWARLRVGDELVYEWPPASPASVRTLRPVPRQRDGGTAPRQPHRR